MPKRNKRWIQETSEYAARLNRAISAGLDEPEKYALTTAIMDLGIEPGLPCWPVYRENGPGPERLLWETDGRIIEDEGRAAQISCTWPLAQGALDNFVTGPGMVISRMPLLELPWLHEALRDPQVHAYRAGDRGLQWLRWRGGRKARWIVDGSMWNVRGGDNEQQATLRDLRATYEHVGVGIRPTPSGLGQAILRRAYPRDVGAFRGVSDGDRSIRGNLVGGRVDTVQPDFKGRMFESDMNSAYASVLHRLPGGMAQQIHSGDERQYGGVTSYRRYDIDAFEPDWRRMLGPLPCRNPATGIVEYHTTESWRGWYWREEIEEALALGWVCTPHEGLYWTEWNTALASAQRRLWSLRQTAPSPQVADLIKLATVAGIGRWCGSEAVTRIGTPDPTNAADTMPYIDPELGRIDGLMEWPEQAVEQGFVYLASYIYAQCRLALYRRAAPYAARGTLVATNYDAVYTTEQPQEPSSTAMGCWKWRELHNATVPQPRWLISEEKIRTPGVSR